MEILCACQQILRAKDGVWIISTFFSAFFNIVWIYKQTNSTYILATQLKVVLFLKCLSNQSSFGGNSIKVQLTTKTNFKHLPGFSNTTCVKHSFLWVIPIYTCILQQHSSNMHFTTTAQMRHVTTQLLNQSWHPVPSVAFFIFWLTITDQGRPPGFCI